MPDDRTSVPHKSGSGRGYREVAMTCSECGNPSAGCRAVDCGMKATDITLADARYSEGRVMAAMTAAGFTTKEMSRVLRILKADAGADGA